jgi:hypothetical protein
LIAHIEQIFTLEQHAANVETVPGRLHDSVPLWLPIDC